MRSAISPDAGTAHVAADQARIHVRVVDLHKSHGEHRVLAGVTFDVERGLTNMILGVSGSGKTVLLRQLLQLERPDRGRIEVDGEDIVALDDLALARTRRKHELRHAAQQHSLHRPLSGSPDANQIGVELVSEAPEPCDRVTVQRVRLE